MKSFHITKWLKSVPNGKPSIQSNSNSQLAKVEELIIGESKSWNEQLIRNSFSMREAKVILEIRLSKRSTADRLIWVLDKLGHFTVRSAYNMARVVVITVSRHDLENHKLKMELPPIFSVRV